MKRWTQEFMFWVCAMGIAVFGAIAIAQKCREFDDLRTMVKKLEYEVKAARHDIGVLQAYSLPAEAVKELIISEGVSVK